MKNIFVYYVLYIVVNDYPAKVKNTTACSEVRYKLLCSTKKIKALSKNKVNSMAFNREFNVLHLRLLSIFYCYQRFLICS